jgi:hypothetical protein
MTRPLKPSTAAAELELGPDPQVSVGLASNPVGTKAVVLSVTHDGVTRAVAMTASAARHVAASILVQAEAVERSCSVGPDRGSN